MILHYSAATAIPRTIARSINLSSKERKFKGVVITSGPEFSIIGVLANQQIGSKWRIGSERFLRFFPPDDFLPTSTYFGTLSSQSHLNNDV